MILALPRALELDIMNFVRVNEIEDINLFLTNCLRDGYNIAKFGTSPRDNFEKENKPLKVENYDNKEESNTEGLERKEVKRKGRPKKETPVIEEVSEPVKEEEQPVVQKKKIRIIKK